MKGDTIHETRGLANLSRSMKKKKVLSRLGANSNPCVPKVPREAGTL